MAQQQRTSLDKSVAAVLAALTFYLASIVPATATTQTIPAYSGEAIFRGVFLDDGAVAKLFPEIWENPTVVGYRDQALQGTTADQVAAQRNALIAALRVQDPTFFDRFGREMQSGDRIRIQQAMNEAAERVLRNAKDSGGEKLIETPAPYKTVNTYIYLAVVIAVLLVIAIPPGTVAAHAQLESGLQRDVMVDLAARRLAAQASH